MRRTEDKFVNLDLLHGVCGGGLLFSLWCEQAEVKSLDIVRDSEEGGLPCLVAGLDVELAVLGFPSSLVGEELWLKATVQFLRRIPISRR